MFKMFKGILFFCLLISNSFSKESDKITYEKILLKNYENKALFLTDVKALFSSQPNDEKIKDTNKILVNITKTNYASLLKNYTNYFIENYFNSKFNSTYNSYLFVLNALPLDEGFKYFQSNNPTILIENLKKGNYIKPTFNNKSLKQILKDDKDSLEKFNAIFTFELVEFVNFKKSKSYWTTMDIRFSYNTENKELLITHLEFKVK